MNKHFVTLFAQSPVHVGAGNSVGAVDSPVMRERHTRIPIIPGSAVKGVISDLWGSKREKDGEAYRLFGSEDSKNSCAGQLLIGEARVLAFPLRSAKQSFVWITCPLVLERFKRDSGLDFEVPEITGEEKCYCSEDIEVGDAKTGRKVILEEYTFESVDNVDENIIKDLKEITNEKIWTNSVEKRLVVVSDEIFSFFVENACEIVARTKINDETGTVADGSLFNQEQVPSETLFYFPVGAEDKTDHPANKAFELLKGKIDNKTLQFGGDETIGLGFCSVKFNGKENK